MNRMQCERAACCVAEHQVRDQLSCRQWCICALACCDTGVFHLLVPAADAHALHDCLVGLQAYMYTRAQEDAMHQADHGIDAAAAGPLGAVPGFAGMLRLLARIRTGFFPAESSRHTKPRQPPPSSKGTGPIAALGNADSEQAD